MRPKNLKTQSTSLPLLVVETVAVEGLAIDTQEAVSLVGQTLSRLKSDFRDSVGVGGEDPVLVRKLDLDFARTSRVHSPLLRFLLSAHEDKVSPGHDLVFLGSASSGRNNDSVIFGLLDAPLLSKMLAIREKADWGIERWVDVRNVSDSEEQAGFRVFDQVGSLLNGLGDDHLKGDQGQGEEGLKHSIERMSEHGKKCCMVK